MEIIWQAHWRTKSQQTTHHESAQVLTYCKKNEVFEHAIPIFYFQTSVNLTR